MRFAVETRHGACTAGRGVPFGTAIACFLANVYLTPIDRALASLPGVRYFRYADDLLVLTPQRDAARTAATRLDALFAELKLASKRSHEQTLRLDRTGTRDPVFVTVPKFRHLGLEFRADASVGLSRDKSRKICNLFRYAFRHAEPALATMTSAHTRAGHLIGVARGVIERGIRSIAIVDYYLKHVDDEAQLRLIDRWLAEEILARALGTGHRKSNFGVIGFDALRAMGLPSLRHRRRLLRHGNLQSSVLALRTNAMLDRERMRRKRRMEREGRRPGPRTFSPGLEAAAKSPS